MSEPRVTAGSKLALRPSAGFRNDTISCVEDWQRRRQLGTGGRKPEGGPPKFDIVKVRNNTGGNLRRGEVVELSTFLLATLEQEHRWFSGVTPDLTHAAWGITIKPIPATDIDEVLCVGVCIAHVLIVDETHQYANRVSGSTVLRSAAIGPVKIVAKPTGGTPPEERECVVQLVDESSPEPKIVTPRYQLYAAFGGGDSSTAYNPNLDYGNVEGNSLAISTGNYIPNSAGSTATMRNRKFYPGDCYVWKRNSSGVLYNTGEVISCVNPTGLPIMGNTWCIARKVQGSDEWMATKIGEFAHAAKTFAWSGAADFIEGEAKFVRGSAAVPKPESTASELTDWAHAGSNGDVFIHHPGTYTITFGAEVQRFGTAGDDVEITDSGSDTFDLPQPIGIEVDCVHNWNPAGDLYTSWNALAHAAKTVYPASGQGWMTVERTYTVNHTLDNWHGQPYLRLSIAGKVSGAAAFGADSAGQIGQAWITIRPEGGGQVGGNEGTGYNAFLGGSGAFQWWGGGSEPVDFDEDGVEI